MGERVRKVIKRTLGCVIAAALICLVILAVNFKQEVRDFFSAQGFDPSPRAVEVLNELELTPRGERIFLASRPTIDGSQHFNTQCSGVDHSESGHVLGCFADDRIRLFDVTDERISDIVEVTAAHELLHAAFARTSETERKELSLELQNAFDELTANDSTLIERMSVYEHLPEAAYMNELHSVLGSEARTLPANLEAHYATLFENRDTLIDRFDKFHAVFNRMKLQGEALEQEMTGLRSSIEQRNIEYDALVNEFNADAALFRARNERFEFSNNVTEFETIRSELAARRDALDAMLTGIQTDINHYNDLRAQLEELGQQSSELDGHLNSDLAPVSDTPE